MLLSIAMMVKNEEKHLRECLTSIKPILDNIDSELIIVDTGSTDSSVEIAREFTDKVYFHPWENDFSGMRNKTISYSSGEWIFILDGDEVIEDCTSIIEFIKSKESKKYNSGVITGINYLSSTDRSQFITLSTMRFFRNDGTFRYDGAVHNQPVCKEPTKNIMCKLHHYGYVSDDKELMEKKFQRTATILKKELEKEPNNVYYRYQLSTSYSMHGDNEEALEEIIKAYELCRTQNKMNFRYVYMSYAKCLLALGKFVDIEKVCKEGLEISNKETVDKIDLYFLLGRSYHGQGRKEKAIETYNKYLDLMDKYNSGALEADVSIINNTVAFEGRVYKDIATLYYNDKEYDKVRETILRIKKNEVLINIMKLVISTYLELGDADSIYDYYNKVVLDGNKDVEEEFFFFLEEKKLNVDKDIVIQVEKKFRVCNNVKYSKFNVIRCLEDENVIYNKLIEFKDEYDINKAPIYMGDLFVEAMDIKLSLGEMAENLSYRTINGLLEYITKKYKNFKDMFISYLNARVEYDFELSERRVVNSMCRFLLLNKEISDQEYTFVFNIYIENGMRLVSTIYSDYVIEEEKILEAKTEEDGFFIVLVKACYYMNEDNAKYIECLKKALKVYPVMTRGIEIILKEFEESFNSADREMNELKEKFKMSISSLINCNEIKQARILIGQYEEIVGKDKDIILLKSKLAIKEKESQYLN